MPLTAREWAASALGALLVALAIALLLGLAAYTFYPRADPVLDAEAIAAALALGGLGCAAAGLLRR